MSESGDTANLEAVMRRALLLAERGPVTGGNPQVGCVLLDSTGKTIAEGWHHGAGTNHAETTALLAAGGSKVDTAVVTLEPCAHQGRTAPCTDALIAAGVRRVVFATTDPGAGAGGAAKLRAHGVEVIAGLLVQEGDKLLEKWLVAERRQRPWTILKWAQSLDGRAAAADGSSKWITGSEARQDVHRRRGEVDAILTGTGTVLADDPAYTARSGGSLLPHQPLPVVIGHRIIPEAAKIRSHPSGFLRLADLPLADVLAELYRRGVRLLLVEAGPTLTSAVLRAGFADEIVTYVAPVLLGGPMTALTDIGVPDISSRIRLDLFEVSRLGADLALTLRPVATRSQATGDLGQ